MHIFRPGEDISSRNEAREDYDPKIPLTELADEGHTDLTRRILQGHLNWGIFLDRIEKETGIKFDKERDEMMWFYYNRDRKTGFWMAIKNEPSWQNGVMSLWNQKDPHSTSTTLHLMMCHPRHNPPIFPIGSPVDATGISLGCRWGT